MSRKGGKKTFAEKLSNKLDKLAKPKDKERTFNKAYQEVYRDYYGNIVVPRPGGSGGPGHDLWPPPHHYQASPAPKRTFHNVIRRGRSAPSHQSSGHIHSLANRTWSGWDGGGGQSAPGLSRSSDHNLYTDPVLYDEYHNFAINSNVCMCEDYLDGTNRGKKPKKKCKKCGYDRLGFDPQQHGSMVRRSISEESINNAPSGSGLGYSDPYDVMRRKHKMMISQKPVFYDEQDEYEDIDFIPRPQRLTNMRSSSSRKIKPKASRSRSPMQRRSSSPVHKKNARTQSMIVNNRNLLNTKDNREMQNIAIRASPMRSASSVTGNNKPKTTSDGNRNIVTVNGCATKNSSIIYLSPDAVTNSSPVSSSTELMEYQHSPHPGMYHDGLIKLRNQIWMQLKMITKYKIIYI